MTNGQVQARVFTADDVVDWLVAQIESVGHLYQASAVNEIRSRFGDQFLYQNSNGNPAINQQVMKLFNRRTRTEVVWIAKSFMWRMRRATDKPGRRQAR